MRRGGYARLLRAWDPLNLSSVGAEPLGLRQPFAWALGVGLPAFAGGRGREGAGGAFVSNKERQRHPGGRGCSRSSAPPEAGRGASFLGQGHRLPSLRRCCSLPP